MRFLLASDFVPDPDAGSAGSIFDTGDALTRAGHEVDYLWRAEEVESWIPHPFFSRWRNLPRRQTRQISDHLAVVSYDVVIIYQPYAAAAFEELPQLYPDTLFLNGTHGWEDRFHEARLHFEWDGPFSLPRRLGLHTTKMLIDRLCRRTARASHGIVCPTKRCQSYLLERYGVPLERMGLVRTGLDDVFFRAAPERVPSTTVRMLFVGNYLPLRARALEAMLPSIGARYPNATMTFVVNSGAAREVDAKFRPHFGQRLTVRTWVRRSEITKIYAAHDLLIFPSLFEGFGRVVLEGMSNGLCVVGFAEGALPEIATSGEDALFCETGDAATLQKLLEQCLDEPAIVYEIGKRARETAKKYPLSDTAEKLVAFCLERRGAVLGSRDEPRA